MKIAVVDLTNRNAVQYNPSLCNNIASLLSKDDKAYLLTNGKNCSQNGYVHVKLFKFVPERFDGSNSIIKKILRSLEVIVNYTVLLSFVLKEHPNIVHFQWLPFLEVNSFERFILKSVKICSSNTKVLLTVHNIYPHRLPKYSRHGYRIRFLHVAKYIDGYIVHLKSAKVEFNSEYGIPMNKIFIAYHGIYTPEGYVQDKRIPDGKFKIVMYGFQNRYKGADLLVEALKLLPQDVLQKTETCIMGKTDAELYDAYVGDLSKLNIEWINKFVSDEFLYKKIGSSDLIVLPYRKISQSGVLLLALSYLKPILTSDLPSFKETLMGFTDDLFFENENPEDFSRLIVRYVKGEINTKKQLERIKELNEVYSWKSTAQSTLQAYNKIIKGDE